MTQPVLQPTAGIETAPTIPTAFLERIRMTPDAVAYREFAGGGWTDISWSAVGRRVVWRRVALAQAGLQPGDRVAIFLPNGIEWVVTDLAAMAQRLITVPVYVRDGAANICHVLRDSGATLCVTDNADRWSSLGEEADALPDLQKIWALDGADQGGDSRLFQCFEAEPSEVLAPVAAHGDGLATIIYTSGTTGPPKGVMLSHRALLWNACAVGKVDPIHSDDLFLSILPLAHAFERTLGWLCPMLNGSTVAFARSITTLAEDLASQRPTILLAVPRLFEKARDSAVAKADTTALGRWLLRCTEGVGWRRHCTREGTASAPPLFDLPFWAFAGRRIAARFRAGFGGRLRMVISSGAPLSGATYKFMAAMEVPLIEGYGLTEAGPAVTGSTHADRRLGSVGRALPGAELKIGRRQELLVRSPGLMMGYWQNPRATGDIVDADGWLHTGDAAEIVEGRVYIRGRLKDILVLSTGENVNPVPIETAVLADPLIEQACVLGDGKPWCAAVVVVDPDHFRNWAAQICPGIRDPNDSRLRTALTERLGQQMGHVPTFARIRALHIVTQPWNLDSGLITPTLKTKRPKIAARYAREINNLYDQACPLPE